LIICGFFFKVKDVSPSKNKKKTKQNKKIIFYASYKRTGDDRHQKQEIKGALGQPPLEGQLTKTTVVRDIVTTVTITV